MGPWQDLDQRLAPLAAQWGGWLYGVLFLAVLLQTGCILGPVLPGNPLLFAMGLFISQAESGWPIGIVLALLGLAAWAGCLLNFALGRWLGERWLQRSRWASGDRIDRARRFMEQRGTWAVGIGVFLPVIRSWIPFLAGMGGMRPSIFASLTGLASFAWVGVVVGSGYWLGNLPWVQNALGTLALALGALMVVGIALGARRRARASLSN